MRRFIGKPHCPRHARCNRSFPLRRALSGHTLLRAPHSPFLQKQKFLQIRVRYRKSVVLLARVIVSAHENLGELSPAVFRDWRATPPFKRFRVFCGVFSLFALVASRRRTAGGALCLPPCLRVLVAPLPQKSHTASRVAIFGDPVIGAHILFYGRKFTLLPKAVCMRLLGGALAKTSFCLRE